MYSKEENDNYTAVYLSYMRERMLTKQEYLTYFRMKAEGKLKVKERKVFLSEKLKNLKLNYN